MESMGNDEESCTELQSPVGSPSVGKRGVGKNGDSAESQSPVGSPVGKRGVGKKSGSTKSKEMPILFTVISRGTAILCRYAMCAGNFMEVTEQILAKIPRGESGRMTYSHASYFFHYIAHQGIIYLCITDDEFERQRAFLFLSDVKLRFESTYGATVHKALPYAMNGEFGQILATQMKSFTESKDIDKVSKLQGEVNDVKDVLVKSIESLAARGERLELLIDKTENLNANAVTFKTTSKSLARNLWWKNIRIIIIIVIGVAVGIYVIGALICGFTWKECS